MSSNVSADEKRTDSEQSTDSNNPESGWYDLTAFQRDCLVVVAEMETDTVRMAGVEVKRRLEARYDRGEINHGQLYPNLDRLADEDLIEVGSLNKRTNSYELAEFGREVLREQKAAWDDLELPQVALTDGGESA